MLRKRLLNLLRNQKEEERISKSRLIKNRLFATPEFQRSRTVMFYAAFDGEVETIEMMRQSQKLGKRIVLPTVIKDQKRIVPVKVEQLSELQDGPYGIKEPVGNPDARLDLKELDLVIVPAVAFDKDNNRLGRGGGYYDRFLSGLPSSVPTFGLAFDFQVLNHLPELSSHDLRVSRVIANS